MSATELSGLDSSSSLLYESENLFPEKKTFCFIVLIFIRIIDQDLSNENRIPKGPFRVN